MKLIDFIYYSIAVKPTNNLLRTMKLSVLLCIISTATLFAGNTYSQNATVSLHMKNASMQDIFREIEKQSEYRFFYNGSQIDLDKKVNIQASKTKVSEVLNNLLSSTDIAYKLIDKHIVLVSVSAPREANETSTTVQQKKVSGTILDANTGEALPGVNVVIEGTTTGVITDVDGKFSINVSNPNAVLVISYVGYMNERVNVNGQSAIDIKLTPDIQKLEEVVVVGYGVQKKSLVTGSISSVKSADIQNTSISQAQQALQGKTSGVQVINGSGSPGSPMKIRIRGFSSNNNSDPIYIVDGVKTTDITNIDPNDIKTMEVLKDAASTAIYGAEGANGVIMITTKGGQAGKTIVNYDYQYGIQSVGKKPKLMNSSQYATYMQEAGLLKNVDTSTNTDWLGELFETAPMQKHHISFSGGNDKSTYSLSASYLNQDGVIKGSKDNFERYTVRFNSEHKISKWVKVGNTFSYSSTNRAAVNEASGEFGGVVSSALMIDPTTPVEYNSTLPSHVQALLTGGKALRKAPNGNYYGISQYVLGEIVNPFVTLDITNGKTTQDRLLGNIFVDVSPFEGLTMTSRVNMDLSFQNAHSWNPTYYYTSERNNGTAKVIDNNDYFHTWAWENFASYSKTIGSHDFNIMIGMSAEEYKHRITNAQGGPMIMELPSFSELDYISSQSNDQVNGRLELNKKVSYFGRASYSYLSKYLLQGSLRRDGAALTQLPKDGRWGIFPSVSAGWVMSNEEFFPKEYLSHAKLRASWGKNGSLSSLGNYPYASLVSATSNGFALVYPMADGSFNTVTELGQLANPDLKWETSVQTDFGVDLRAFNDRLTFSVDYYIKKTTDLITANTPALEAGNTASSINAGDVENRGFEFDLGFKNKIGDLNYSINCNLSTLHNEVTYLNPSLSRLPGANIGPGGSWTATAFEKNQSVWYFRGYKTHGIDPKTGNPIFVDKDGKDVSVASEGDKQFIGSPIPDLQYGGNVNLEYKGFDLAVSIQGQSGNEVLMGWIRTDRPTINMPEEFYNNRWSASNTTGTMPKAGADSKTWNSDLLVFDGSFLRVKQIQVGYTLPINLIQNLKMGSARLYVSLEDFFTFTKYPGMDPEVGSNNGANNNYGIDRGSYPIARKVMFGASISF